MIVNVQYIDFAYFFPGAMAAMIIKMLLNDRLSVAMTILLGCYGTIIFNGEAPSNLDISMGFYIMFSGFAAIIILSRENFKTKVLSAGILLSLVNVAFLYSLLFIMNGSYSNMEYLYYCYRCYCVGSWFSCVNNGIIAIF